MAQNKFQFSIGECPICLLPFEKSTQSMIPRILTCCGNTVCTQCIETQISFSNPRASSYKCPFCKKEQQVKQTEKLKNFLINRQLLNLEQKEKPTQLDDWMVQNIIKEFKLCLQCSNQQEKIITFTENEKKNHLKCNQDLVINSDQLSKIKLVPYKFQYQIFEQYIKKLINQTLENIQQKLFNYIDNIIQLMKEAEEEIKQDHISLIDDKLIANFEIDQNKEITANLINPNIKKIYDQIMINFNLKSLEFSVDQLIANNFFIVKNQIPNQQKQSLKSLIQNLEEIIPKPPQQQNQFNYDNIDQNRSPEQSQSIDEQIKK